MKKTITSILAMAALLCSPSAMAQQTFTYDLHSFVGESYEGLKATVDIAAIEAAIGCEIANAQINPLYADGDIDEERDYKLGQYQVDETTTDSYDGWRDADGNFAKWADESSQFYVKINLTDESPQIYEAGGHPTHNGLHLTEPTTYTCSYRIANPETEAYCLLKVNLIYMVKPDFEITTNLADLNILRTIELDVTQVPRSNSSTLTYSAYCGDIVKDLGCDALVWDFFWNTEFTYVGMIDSETDTKSASLTKISTSTAWFNTIFDEETGQPKSECVQGSSSDDTRFNLSINGFDEDSIYVGIGQYANRLKAGDSYYTSVYFINGTNAIELKVKLTIVPDEITILPFEEKTKVGSEIISFKRDINQGYSTSRIDIDIDSILALFTDKSLIRDDLAFAALTDGNLTTTYTTGEGQSGAAAGGFWMTIESRPVDWSVLNSDPESQGYFINFFTTYMTMGQFPSRFDGGEKTTGSLYLFNKNEYYEFVMDIQIGDAPVPTEYTVETCTTVATQEYEYLMVPNTNGEYQNYGTNEAGETDYHLMQAPIDLDLDFIKSQIGDSFAFYGEQFDEEGNVTYSNKYSCDPNPGFWMRPGGNTEEAEEELKHISQVATWGGGNSYGICYANGIFQFFQYPSARSVGDYYTDNFYLVNLAEGKKIQYIINVKYVAEIETFNIAGTQDIVAPIHSEEDPQEMAITEFDLSAMYEALGCTEDEFEAAGEWYAKDAATGAWSKENFVDPGGFSFNADGLTVNDGTEEFSAGFNDMMEFQSLIIDEANFDKTYHAQLQARYDGKVYVFNVTVTADNATAIQTVNAAKNAGTIYNLQGQRLNNLQQGINIVGGRKVLVK